jgi:hypothetical protein
MRPIARTVDQQSHRPDAAAPSQICMQRKPAHHHHPPPQSSRTPKHQTPHPSQKPTAHAHHQARRRAVRLSRASARLCTPAARLVLTLAAHTQWQHAPNLGTHQCAHARRLFWTSTLPSPSHASRRTVWWLFPPSSHRHRRRTTATHRSQRTNKPPTTRPHQASTTHNRGRRPRRSTASTPRGRQGRTQPNNATAPPHPTPPQNRQRRAQSDNCTLPPTRAPTARALLVASRKTFRNACSATRTFPMHRRPSLSTTKPPPIHCPAPRPRVRPTTTQQTRDTLHTKIAAVVATTRQQIPCVRTRGCGECVRALSVPASRLRTHHHTLLRHATCLLWVQGRRAVIDEPPNPMNNQAANNSRITT